MSDVETLEDLPPVAHATIAYLGPVSPHWELRGHFGEEKMLDDFWARVHARLLLLPKHDPQFRRNRERVNRDAERELIRLDWDLGDEEPPRQPRREPRQAPVVEAPAEVEEAPADEPVAENETAADETPVETEAVTDEAPAEDAPAAEAPDAAPEDAAPAEPAAEEAADEEASAEES